MSSLLLCFFESLLAVHLWIQASILTSWLVIGPLIHKPGMCLLTEIQKKINHYYDVDFPDSYMLYLYNKLGVNINNTQTVDRLTFTVFAVCSLISVIRINLN
ncbi:MAG: hypothetical protein OEY11_10495 [Gammaproteobacteria bacterium]|nr:hypothetical protein [Gammaproteobacteria bacterium]